jgi:pilus retraction protein PilT
MDIGYFLKLMTEKNASDMFLTTGAPVYIKVEGKLYPLGNTGLPAGMVKKIAYSLMDEGQVPAFERDLEFNMAIAVREAGRFRVNVFKQRGEVGMVIRAIKSEIPTIEQLKLPPILRDIVMEPRGLVLVVGSTGSGKSTSLAAMVDHLNTTVDHHIITIEDPIEFYHNHKKSTVNQREVGVDVTSFAEAIRRALRQDPDVILVGELRDLETIEAAITAAETGHVVFGTLHTSSAAGTINRVIDVFPSHQQDQIRTQLATAIIGILAQQLVPRIGGGRVAAFETLVVTPGIANLIRENKIFRITSAIQTGSKYGMQLLDDHLFQHWRNELATNEYVLNKSNSPDDLAKRIAAAERGIFDEPQANDPG